MRLLPPLPPRAKRVVGRGRGWGVSPHATLAASLLKPPPPPPSRASFARLGPHRYAEGGEKKASKNPRKANSRRPITAHRLPSPRSIPNSRNNSASPPRR